MAQGNKNSVVIVGLVVLGLIMAVLALSHKPQAGKEVSLSDVFSQAPAVQAGKPADPVPSPAIITSPEMGKESGFMVQVYSFQDHNRAEKALENLKTAGYKAFMEVSDLGEKGTWYRVRIGGLENETQAKAMLDQVRKNYQSGIIVKPQIQTNL